MVRKTLFFLFRSAGILAISFVIAIPLFSKDGTNFGIQPGLLLAAVLFVSYLLLGRAGIAFQPNQHRFRLHFADLLILGAFPLYLIYFGNERFLSSLDTLATRQLPVAILKHGTLDLSEQPVVRGSRATYAVLARNGELLSAFPIGTGLLAIPHTALGMAATGKDGSGLISLMWEKHFAALCSIASVLFLFYAMRSRFGEVIAAKASIVFALATSLFSCASQAMWSFTGEIFFLSLALLLLMNKPYPILAGLSLGAAFLCRPTASIFLIFAAPLLYAHSRRDAFLFLTAAVSAILLVIAVLWFSYGHPLGGYGLQNQTATAWRSDFIKAFAGNLFSPSRGFLIFYPFVLIFMFVIFRFKQWNSWLWGCTAAIAAILVLTSLYAKWWGGHSLGPRLLTETSIFIALLSVPVWMHWSKLGSIRIALILLLTFSMVTQFFLVYNVHASEWNGSVQVDQHPEILWSWEKSQVAAAWGL